MTAFWTGNNSLISKRSRISKMLKYDLKYNRSNIFNFWSFHAVWAIWSWPEHVVDLSLTMILLKVRQHFLYIKHNCHVQVRVIKLIKFDMINNLECCGGRCWECSRMAVEWKLIKLVTAQITILIDVSAIQTDSHRLNEKIAISNYYPKLSSYMSYTKVDSEEALTQH